VVTRAYTPERGDVVWLDFTPQAGHEQAGRRPALVLSPKAYNGKTDLMLCCPVTSQVKGYPFEVPMVPVSGKVAGVALSDQIRCLDWRSRKAAKFATATAACVSAVGAKVKLLLP
jgi:mRNA interferase MazF